MRGFGGGVVGVLGRLVLRRHFIAASAGDGLAAVMVVAGKQFFGEREGILWCTRTFVASSANGGAGWCGVVCFEVALSHALVVSWSICFEVACTYGYLGFGRARAVRGMHAAHRPATYVELCCWDSHWCE
jgi:hypothetical protein